MSPGGAGGDRSRGESPGLPDAARFGSPAPPDRRAAVAIGVFDGLHLGHLAILERALARARLRGGPAVAVSFDPHPDVVLRPGEFHYPAPLTPMQEKRRRLLAMGMDELRVIPFTRELARLSPEAFVRDYLVHAHQPFALVAGEGFALGRGRSGNVDRLREIGREHGFEVEAVPLATCDGRPISSTRIRELLGEGRVLEAARLLGRRYALDGTVVGGHGIGKTLGFPTANLRLHEEKLLPRDGIYAGLARIAGESTQRPAAVSLGMRPTFDGREREIEVFLLDWEGQLRGTEVEVEFVDWLRPEVRFETAEALISAMRDDVAETRRRLEVHASRPAAT